MGHAVFSAVLLIFLITYHLKPYSGIAGYQNNKEEDNIFSQEITNVQESKGFTSKCSRILEKCSIIWFEDSFWKDFQVYDKKII